MILSIQILNQKKSFRVTTSKDLRLKPALSDSILLLFNFSFGWIELLRFEKWKGTKNTRKHLKVTVGFTSGLLVDRYSSFAANIWCSRELLSVTCSWRLLFDFLKRSSVAHTWTTILEETISTHGYGSNNLRLASRDKGIRIASHSAGAD